MASESFPIILSVISLVVSVFVLYWVTRMNAYQRHEYAFFLTEHQEKLGVAPGRWARFLAWNAALGGRAPKWHWIDPVTSPQASFKGHSTSER